MTRHGLRSSRPSKRSTFFDVHAWPSFLVVVDPPSHWTVHVRLALVVLSPMICNQPAPSLRRFRSFRPPRGSPLVFSSTSHGFPPWVSFRPPLPSRGTCRCVSFGCVYPCGREGRRRLVVHVFPTCGGGRWPCADGGWWDDVDAGGRWRNSNGKGVEGTEPHEPCVRTKTQGWERIGRRWIRTCPTTNPKGTRRRRMDWTKTRRIG